MTDMSYYRSGGYPPAGYPPPDYRPAAPGRSGDGAPDTSGTVLVSVAGPAAQRRATVAFRVILAIPHFFVLYVLGIAAGFVAVIGWLGALVTGRLPGFAASYLAGYVRWYSRVGAYLLLLTDAYPPFSLADDGYPVRMAVSPGRLNRLAVLFRVVLAIPAAVVSMILLSGVTTIVIVIAWLTALVSGRLPAALHGAFAAVFRYTTRYYCYLYLLTGDYPAGLFGDKPGARGPEDGPSGGPAYEAPYWDYPPPGQGYGAQGYGAPGYGAPSAYGAPGYGNPASGYGPQRVPGRHRAPAPGASGQPASRDLVLSGGAKRLVGLIIVLGVLTVAGAGAAAGTAINSTIQRDRKINQLNAAITRHNGAVAQEHQAARQVKTAISQVTAANSKLNSKVNAAINSSDATCATVDCFNSADATAASDVGAFGHALRAVPFPAGAAGAANKLAAAATADSQAWEYMAQAVSLTDGVNRATRAEKSGKQFDDAFSALMKSLNQEGAELNQKAAALNTEAAALTQRAAVLNVPVKVLTSDPAAAPSVT